EPLADALADELVVIQAAKVVVLRLDEIPVELVPVAREPRLNPIGSANVYGSPGSPAVVAMDFFHGFVRVVAEKRCKVSRVDKVGKGHRTTLHFKNNLTIAAWA